MFNLLKYLPYLVRAAELAATITSGLKTGRSIWDILGKEGREVFDIIEEAGKDLFPSLSREEQVAAGALRFDFETVKKIQAQLNTLRIMDPPLTVDGTYGPLTREAVRKFQQSKGLTADGWAGPATQNALDAAIV
jgi:murein L,D-transpeptidase YcbB/YkuD